MSSCHYVTILDKSVRRTCDKDSTCSQNESDKKRRQKIYNTRTRKANPTTTKDKEIMGTKPLAEEINCKYKMHNQIEMIHVPLYPSDCTGFA